MIQFDLSLDGGVPVLDVDIVWTILPKGPEPSYTVEEYYFDHYSSMDMRRFDILLTGTYGGTTRTDMCTVELSFAY